MVSSSETPAPRPLRSILVLVVFWCYAIGLVLAVRLLAHHSFTGWPARLATMGGIALGLLPWGHWLRPRLIWALGLCGRGVLTGAYVLLLWPFAIVSWVAANAFRPRQQRGSYWQPRQPLPNTLQAAKLEY